MLLNGRSFYKANYDFKEAAEMCVLLQRSFYSVKKSIEECLKDKKKKNELINTIAEDDDLFISILERRKQRKSKNEKIKGKKGSYS